MSLGPVVRHAPLAAFVIVVVTGCSPAQGGNGSVSAHGAPIQHSGGQADETTAPFTTKTSSIVIEYKLSQASSRPDIVFSVEQDGGGGLYNSVSTVSRPISGFQGSASLALSPGTYRIRVETDVAWTADIYESKP